MEIIYAIITTIAGTCLGIAITKWDSWRETAKHGDLRGEWFVISHSGDHTFVRDKITISKRRGKLYMLNEGNEFGFSYEAFCSVDRNNVIHGTWRSIRKGSSLNGRVLMIVNPQGTCITGVYSGSDSAGTDLILAWAMSTTEEGLENATASLESYFKFPECV